MTEESNPNQDIHRRERLLPPEAAMPMQGSTR